MAFTPKQQNWRWYQNNASEPTVPLADENVAPSMALATTIIRLRFSIAETGGADGSGAVTLEYSTDDNTFLPVAVWNYANGAATAGNETTTYLTTDGTTHGLYHETGTLSETWAANAIRELDFAIALQAGTIPLGNYYFRVKIAGTEVPLNTGETHPYITITAPQTGTNVSKINLFGVLSPPTGQSVSKANVYGVLSPPTGQSVSKALTYAVLEEITTSSTTTTTSSSTTSSSSTSSSTTSSTASSSSTTSSTQTGSTTSSSTSSSSTSSTTTTTAPPSAGGNIIFFWITE